MKTMQQERRNELRNVMNTAWVIARQTGEAFGGCLKKAWVNAKLHNALKRGVVRFTFRKIDGNIRVAFGTLQGVENMVKGDRRSGNSTLQVYYDLEKNAFRCFKRANLLSAAI